MIRAIALLLILALPAAAQIGADQPNETPLLLPPGAVETARDVTDPGRYALPVGRFTALEQPQHMLEGRVIRRAWRLPVDRADTLTVLRALRPQLAEAGFETLFECATATCGGYDYRFNTEVLAPPAMELDLTDFRALTARRMGGDAPDAHINLLISRTPRGGFVQAIEARASGTPPPLLAPPQAALVAPGGAAQSLGDALDETGHAVLEGVDFASGNVALDAAGVMALAPLANLLAERPDLALVLVGHTDTDGGLAANIALSRARAQAVRRVLIDTYGVAPSRLSADGVGYLAPRAPNQTETGRARNRRVEVVRP